MKYLRAAYIFVFCFSSTIAIGSMKSSRFSKKSLFCKLDKITNLLNDLDDKIDTGIGDGCCSSDDVNMVKSTLERFEDKFDMFTVDAAADDADEDSGHSGDPSNNAPDSLPELIKAVADMMQEAAGDVKELWVNKTVWDCLQWDVRFDLIEMMLMTGKEAMDDLQAFLAALQSEDLVEAASVLRETDWYSENEEKGEEFAKHLESAGQATDPTNSVDDSQCLERGGTCRVEDCDGTRCIFWCAATDPSNSSATHPPGSNIRACCIPADVCLSEEEELEVIMRAAQKVVDAIDALTEWLGSDTWNKLDPKARAILVEMYVVLGEDIRNIQGLKEALENNDYGAVSEAIRNSDWAGGTPEKAARAAKQFDALAHEKNAEQALEWIKKVRTILEKTAEKAKKLLNKESWDCLPEVVRFCYIDLMLMMDEELSKLTTFLEKMREGNYVAAAGLLRGSAWYSKNPVKGEEIAAKLQKEGMKTLPVNSADDNQCKRRGGSCKQDDEECDGTRCLFWCPSGKCCIPKDLCLSETEKLKLWKIAAQKAIDALLGLRKWLGTDAWKALDPEAQCICIEMWIVLGENGMNSIPGLKDALKKKDYDATGKAIEGSDWAKENPNKAADWAKRFCELALKKCLSADELKALRHLLDQEIKTAIKAVKDWLGVGGVGFWDCIYPEAKYILIKLMIYVGPVEFKRQFDGMKSNNYNTAARIIRESDWGRRNRARAEELAKIMEDLQQRMEEDCWPGRRG